ncbi:MAG: hypothetical protein HZB11_01450 [Candidatus Yonathbacteria bacterium]|nr:hypothetical protein [Candidatus Yonathbacteria bacterium]
MAKKLTLGIVSANGEIVLKVEKMEEKVRPWRRIPILQVLRVLIGTMTALSFGSRVILTDAKIWSSATTMWMLAFSFMFLFWLVEYIMHNLLRIKFDLYKTE